MKTYYLLLFTFLTGLVYTQENIDTIVSEIILNCEGKKYGIDSAKTIQDISLYRDFYDKKAYSDAIPYWRKILANAPKSSENIYIRGAKMYKKILKTVSNEQKESIIDTVLALHDIRIHCFGSSAKKEKSKTFDWYTYRKKGNESFVLKQFEKTFNLYIRTEIANPANFLSYYMDMAVYANKKNIIDNDSVVIVFSNINEEIEKQVDGEKRNEYLSIQNQIIEKLNEGNYITCEKIIPLVENTYNKNPNDTLVILKSYKRLKYMSCTESSLFLEIAEKVAVIKPSVAIFKFLARKFEKQNDIQKTIFYIEKAIALSVDNLEKEKLTMKISSLYYSQFNLSKSRKYAKKALEINPNSGKAYITIGRTYASSGKICGTGTDFKSHTIVWAAVDTWRKAIAVDNSVRADAQKLINKYTQYMPTKKELFMNGISIGSKYNISCFGFTTTVRSSD